MELRYQGLAASGFSHLFGLSDDALNLRGMRRMIVDAKPGFPCRVTLEDAEPGERVLLLAFEHQPAHSPFRASGPIFVREGEYAMFGDGGRVGIAANRAFEIAVVQPLPVTAAVAVRHGRGEVL